MRRLLSRITPTQTFVVILAVIFVSAFMAALLGPDRLGQLIVWLASWGQPS